MTTDINDPAWDSLSYAEKNRLLYERQKQMLEEFLERNAISQVQYEKSLHDLTEKMTNLANVCQVFLGKNIGSLKTKKV
ncbi:MAG: hypothetical protein IJK38_08865 [Oscillospiraceae bacterium]|nr:hypothetical protein [Oscillospiraceae bacterium]